MTCDDVLLDRTHGTRAGSAFSILRKQDTGPWVVVRDANMLPAAA